MKIWVNNQPLKLEAEATVAAVVEQFGASGPYAVALNGSFVSQSGYDTTAVNDGDKLEVLSPISGG